MLLLLKILLIGVEVGSERVEGLEVGLLVLLFVVALGVYRCLELGGGGDQVMEDRLEVSVHGRWSAMIVSPDHWGEQGDVGGGVFARVGRPGAGLMGTISAGMVGSARGGGLLG